MTLPFPSSSTSCSSSSSSTAVSATGACFAEVDAGLGTGLGWTFARSRCCGVTRAAGLEAPGGCDFPASCCSSCLILARNKASSSSWGFGLLAVACVCSICGAVSAVACVCKCSRALGACAVACVCKFSGALGACAVVCVCKFSRALGVGTVATGAGVLAGTATLPGCMFAGEAGAIVVEAWLAWTSSVSKIRWLPGPCC